MVRIHPDPPTDEPGAGGHTPKRTHLTRGAIAQLGERLLCKQEVTGSIPVGSTRHLCGAGAPGGISNQSAVAWIDWCFFSEKCQIGCSLTIRDGR